LAWLRALPLSYVAGDYLFVHAGIAPGVPLEAQQQKDLLWIRAPFLDSVADHGRMVVHGHTPGASPVVRRNRICVDTGAVQTGVLTAAVLDGSHPPRFLQTTGRSDV
jgi:serine/threonine protein phosphatase 1